MKINEMTALLSGEARTAAAHADAEIISAYAGDMLSDVLALGSQPDVLLTGLLHPHRGNARYGVRRIPARQGAGGLDPGAGGKMRRLRTYLSSGDV